MMLLGELIWPTLYVLDVPGIDLKVVVYTAAAGSPEAEKLDFLRGGAVRFRDPLMS